MPQVLLFFYCNKVNRSRRNHRKSRTNDKHYKDSRQFFTLVFDTFFHWKWTVLNIKGYVFPSSRLENSVICMLGVDSWCVFLCHINYRRHFELLRVIICIIHKITTILRPPSIRISHKINKCLPSLIPSILLPILHIRVILSPKNLLRRKRLPILAQIRHNLLIH